MKKVVTLLVLLVGLMSYSQILKTDKYEIYLINYSLNEVNIAKGMYLTKNIQYFHEGTLEVNYLDTGSTKSMHFFFSIWDKKYKRFLVKDLSDNIIQPEFIFESNQKIEYKNKSGDEKSIEIEAFDNIENVILNNMLAWLIVNEKYNEAKSLTMLKKDTIKKDTIKKTIKVLNK